MRESLRGGSMIRLRHLLAEVGGDRQPLRWPLHPAGLRGASPESMRAMRRRMCREERVRRADVLPEVGVAAAGSREAPARVASITCARALALAGEGL